MLPGVQQIGIKWSLNIAGKTIEVKACYLRYPRCITQINNKPLNYYAISQACYSFMFKPKTAEKRILFFFFFLRRPQFFGEDYH